MCFRVPLLPLEEVFQYNMFLDTTTWKNPVIIPRFLLRDTVIRFTVLWSPRGDVAKVFSVDGNSAMVDAPRLSPSSGLVAPEQNPC